IYGALVFGILFIVELVLFGMPNDLFEVYTNYDIQYSKRGAIARLIGFLFPWIYLGLKTSFIGLSILPGFNWRKYDSLTTEMKISVSELK
ncbi:MAG: hypothetical protein MK066_07670, partial [Crocinitomicaceae bacterium]|nr:hypothetical protein [Crocinitomicaceae bacterium]